MRTLLATVLIIVLAVFAYSYMTGSSWPGSRTSDHSAVGTTGAIDVNTARERGAAVGEKVAVAAEKVKETAEEAALTSKIKAKMVLDDSVKARINNLGGSIPGKAERTPAAFDTYVKAEIARWAPVLKAAAEPAK